jgi:hypothetical protein
MNRIKLLDETKSDLLNKDLKNKKKNTERTIKINDNLLEIGLKKGLIEREKDEFFFIGNYEKFLAFKNKKRIN